MIRVTRYTREDLPNNDWNHFVDESNNGTLFSLASFYLYHDELKPVEFFVFTKKGNWIAVCVGSVQNGVFKSPFAASYGGLIFSKGLRFEDQEEVLLSFESELRSRNVKSIQFVLAPFCYQSEVDQSLDFLLKYHSYVEDQTLISSVIDVNLYSIEAVSIKAIQQIEKAEKMGVLIKQLNDAVSKEKFYEILLDNKAKFSMKPTHSALELQKLDKLLPGHLHYFGAFTEEKMIAGALIFDSNSSVDLAFYIATDYEYSAYSPTNLLIHQFILAAKAKEKKWLDLGVSMETNTDNPMDPRRSLIFFKEHFGSRGQLRSRYVKNL